MACIEPYIINRCEEIQLLIKQGAEWAKDNDQLSAHLAAYSTVLITGVFEDCVEYLFRQRVMRTGDREISNYVSKVIGDRFKNPDYGAISGLLKEFCEEYQQEFKEKIAHDGREATALGSILGNKNSLAHIGTAKIEISIKDADEYFHRVLPILETIENILAAEEDREEHSSEV